jgi:hypothetical protein
MRLTLVDTPIVLLDLSGSTAKGLQVGRYSSFDFGKGGADIDLVHEDPETNVRKFSRW